MRKWLGSPNVRFWLASVGAITIIIGGCYTIAQQATRSMADDSPRIIAQSIKSQLASGTNPKNAIPPQTTDLRSELGIFAIITDNSHKILASSARLDGQTPLPPKGVFEYTLSNGSNSVTWEPSGGVRLATQLITFGSGQNEGFIITGQPLKLAEERVNIFNSLALTTWVASMAWVTAIIFWPFRKSKK